MQIECNSHQKWSLKLGHSWSLSKSKVGRAFPMVIWSDFRMGNHRADDHEGDAPYFSRFFKIPILVDVILFKNDNVMSELTFMILWNQVILR